MTKYRDFKDPHTNILLGLDPIKPLFSFYFSWQKFLQFLENWKILWYTRLLKDILLNHRSILILVRSILEHLNGITLYQLWVFYFIFFQLFNKKWFYSLLLLFFFLNLRRAEELKQIGLLFFRVEFLFEFTHIPSLFIININNSKEYNQA